MQIEIKINANEIKDNFKGACLTALAKCGAFAVDAAFDLSPFRTGRLRNSIGFKIDPEEPAAYVGTDVEYAQPVEFGTVKRAATPFLKPAIANNVQEYEQIISNTLRSLGS